MKEKKYATADDLMEMIDNRQEWETKPKQLRNWRITDFPHSWVAIGLWWGDDYFNRTLINHLEPNHSATTNPGMRNFGTLMP